MVLVLTPRIVHFLTLKRYHKPERALLTHTARPEKEDEEKNRGRGQPPEVRGEMGEGGEGGGGGGRRAIHSSEHHILSTVSD